MLKRMRSALLISLLALGSQSLAAELSGVKTTLCTFDNSKCLLVTSEKSSQSQFANIFTMRQAVVQKIEDGRTETFQSTMVTLDLVNQKLLIFQRLDSHNAKEIQFDLRTLDQKEFLVN
jgi:hypothetical protein